MTSPKLLGYGAWRSPITSELITSEVVGLSQLTVLGDEIYWVESRPAEGGRNVIVRCDGDGSLSDIIPQDFNARTRVHEYGGGAYLKAGERIVFSRFEDQMLYATTRNGTPPTLLTSTAGLRFADGVFDQKRKRIISVCEDHREQGAEAKNYVVSIDLTNGNITTLFSQSDFVSSPRLSPDGRKLAWTTWNHPNMPWNSSELWVADLGDDGSFVKSEKIAGGDAESIFQPQWSPQGVLHFISDKTGWWNPYFFIDGKVESIIETQAEFGRPQWTFGLNNYDFISEDELIVSYVQNGFWKLARLSHSKKRLETVPLPFSAIMEVRSKGSNIVAIGGAPDVPTSVVHIDLNSGKFLILRSSSSVKMDARYVSSPEPLEFPTSDGKVANALYYHPKNDDFKGSSDELPPLIVKIHGGPTSATTAALNLNIQFWTSRGFAVVDVNYGGSSGYGREYQERLKGRWGVVDLDDCINAAKHLATMGRVDGERMAISGGSAGGYTALCALTFRNTFQSGTSLYGISDLEALVRDTHKFESRYPYWLIGPYPKDKKTYQERSPVHYAKQISAPVLFLQGEEDEIVPPNQTEMMANALLKDGKTFGLIMFAGEQHGFRKSESIRRALDAELDFYSILLTRTGFRF